MNITDAIEDLKQFIDARISQTEARFDKKLDQKIGGLRQEMHDGFAGVGEAIDQINERLDKRDAEVDMRLTKLEQQAV